MADRCNIVKCVRGIGELMIFEVLVHPNVEVLRNINQTYDATVVVPCFDSQ